MSLALSISLSCFGAWDGWIAPETVRTVDSNDEVWCPLKVIEHGYLNQITKLSLEEAAGVIPGSAAAWYPNYHKRILDLFESTPAVESFFLNGVGAGTSYQSLIAQVIQTHNTVSGLIDEIRRDFIMETPLPLIHRADERKAYQAFNLFLKKMVIAFRKEDPALRAHCSWRERLDWRKWNEAIGKWKGKLVHSGQPNELAVFLREIGGHYRSLWGEFRACLLKPGPVYWDATVENLSRLYLKSYVGNIHNLTRSERHASIDLVYEEPNEGRSGLRLVWGEVKFFRHPLRISVKTESPWHDLLVQLETYEVIAQKLGISPLIEVLLVQGISREARKNLESRGYRVVGKTVY